VPSFDYTAVGHVTADVLADGSTQPGGGAFYSALQAARLGHRALIVTRGAKHEIEALLQPFSAELELEIQPAPHTTTLLTSAAGHARRQRVLAWAGSIDQARALDTAILHFAPVARETGPVWAGRADFIGLTPQGLIRSWSEPDREIGLTALDPAQLPERLDAAVISDSERDCCAALVAGGRAAPAPHRPTPRGADGGRPVVAITGGWRATLLWLPDGRRLRVDVSRVAGVVDDLGAGDVFAAAFFCALAHGSEPARAAELGHAAAAVRLSAAGPGAIGDRRAVEGRMRQAGARRGADG
jgi:sugar/nucleoside kinase (ribokinase family)